MFGIPSTAPSPLSFSWLGVISTKAACALDSTGTTAKLEWETAPPADETITADRSYVFKAKFSNDTIADGGDGLCTAALTHVVTMATQTLSLPTGIRYDFPSRTLQINYATLPEGVYAL